MNYQIALMVQRAIAFFENNEHAKASNTLKKILEVDKNNLPALQILGLISASKGNFDDAIIYLSKAVSIQPHDGSIQYNLAKAISDSGAHQKSIAHHQKATKLAPQNSKAWVNYGKTLSALSRHEEALVCFDKALDLDSNYIDAILNKGANLCEVGRYMEALVLIERALSINPHLFEGILNKAVILNRLGHSFDALEHYDKALALKPDYHEAWLNKGVTLHALKRYDEALEHYDKALTLKPDYPEAWLNKGVTLHVSKRYDDALNSYDRALTLKPDYHEAYVAKGTSLHILKRYLDALEHYDKALTLKPLHQTDDKDYFLGDMLHIKLMVCNTANLDSETLDLINRIKLGENVCPPFALLTLTDDPFSQYECAKIYAKNQFYSQPAFSKITRTLQKKKIKIGYYSADFREHPVAMLLVELFERHDKEKFDTYAFSFGVDDQSLLRSRIVNAFDTFVDAQRMTDGQITDLSRKYEIDIAIDLSGYTADNRLGIFARRAAPIQISYLGYPGTTGTNFIDYILADKIIIPSDTQNFYSEKVFYLPHSFITDDSGRIPSDKSYCRRDFGIPDNVFIYCCFNNAYKFNPQTISSWLKILSLANDSVLWVSDNNQAFKNNLINYFIKNGIDSRRIIFAPRIKSVEDHLARLSLADLFLDTHIYNAHTTAIDALKANLPILTLAGKSFPSRVAASLLNTVNLPELITHTQSEYESLAIELATNPGKINHLKKTLRMNIANGPLFDSKLFIKNFESALLEIYNQRN